MNSTSSHIFSHILQGQSLLRISMNRGFEAYTIKGSVVDIGGGRHPDYFEHFKKDQVTSITPVDAAISGIDFEKDALPLATSSVDTAICANVLEHIYNYRFLVKEIHRVVVSGGSLIGFVPFLLRYHPDPHDYFRYTKEALEKIFAEAGFRDIKIENVGGGPFKVTYNTIMLSLPKWLCVLLLPFYLFADEIFIKLRPKAKEQYPLGFIFSMKK